MNEMQPDAELKPRTAAVNGRFWGARARDWAEIMEEQYRPLYEAVFERVGVAAGTRHLDVGCGAGLAAEMAATLGARVAAIDAADGLLAVARARLPAADIRQGDLEELPFGDGTFDLVTGFNSFQFAGNPEIALREAARVAKPDGRIVIVTWGEPEGMEAVAVITSLRHLLPPPPPGAPGPFALAKEEALRKLTSDAGLAPLEIFDVDCPYVFPDEATAVRGLIASGEAVRAIELAGEAAVRAARANAIAPFRRAGGSYRIGASFRCLVARP